MAKVEDAYIVVTVHAQALDFIDSSLIRVSVDDTWRIGVCHLAKVSHR